MFYAFAVSEGIVSHDSIYDRSYCCDEYSIDMGLVMEMMEWKES